MRNNIIFSMLVLIFFVSCTDKRNEKLAGKWIGFTKNDGMIEFLEDGTAFWNTLSKRNYKFIDDNTLELTWLSMKQNLDVEFRNDTLILTGPETRSKYISFKVVEKSEKVMKNLAAERIYGAKQKKLLELNVEKTTFDDLKKRILFDENRITSFFKPEVQLYYISALLIDSTRVYMVGQPQLTSNHLEANLHETLESRTLEHFNGYFVSSMLNKLTIKSNQNKVLKGELSNNKGEVMQFFMQLGQAPLLDLSDEKTLNSSMRYVLNRQLGFNVCQKVDVKIDPNNDTFDGEATLPNNETIKIAVKKDGSWKIKSGEIESAKKIAVMVLKNAIVGDFDWKEFKSLKGDEYSFAFSLKTEPTTIIKGVFMADKADWYPIEDIKNFENLVKTQLNRKTINVKDLKFKSLGKGLYEGLAYSFKDDAQPRKINLKYENKSFKWELAPIPKNRKYGRYETELDEAQAAQNQKGLKIQKSRSVISPNTK